MLGVSTLRRGEMLPSGLFDGRVTSFGGYKLFLMDEVLKVR